MDEGSEKNMANTQIAGTRRAGDAKQNDAAKQHDAKQALADYEAAALAIRAKTERLRALRLARDAANPPQPQTAKRKSGAKKSKSGGNSSGSLADWLDDRAKEGRRS